MSKHIVILVHRRTTRADLRTYFIMHLVRRWRKHGYRVSTMTDPRQPVAGDLLFMHVDLSRVPEACLAVAARFAATVNGAVGDIRKSAISRHLVGPDDDWDGPVILKTDLNSAGLPEQHYAGTRGPGHPRGFRSSADYRVFPRLDEVPAEFIDNPRLVVEKFLPEIVDGEYCLRSYNFLGDSEDCFAVYSDHPIVRFSTMKRMEKTEIHPQIRDIREELGFDYGKFDYVVRDGQAILLDANKTPGYLAITDAETRALVRRRAEGIHCLFR